MIAEKSVAALLQYGSMDHLFKANEVDSYKFLRAFVKKHQALPSAETIQAHTDDILIPHKEPSSYYFDLLETRHLQLTLKSGMKKASELLSDSPQEALKTITETAMQLIAHKHSKQVVDFREAHDLLIHAYAAGANDEDVGGLRFGWPTLDKMAGGMQRGDMVSFVGRPQRGKTWQMLYSCHYGWAKAGKLVDPEFDQSRMFVSMEMDVLAIQQRLAAMHTHLPADHVKKSALTSLNFSKYKKGLTEVKGFGAPFYVVDGNLAATVEDIWMMARQLKPAAIFIDGGYLVKHPTERDRFRRVAENAELIKKELCPLAPTACSWQFARSASKKNKKVGEKPDLDDIGYTDAIGQVSSLVLGLFEEDTVETLQQRRIEILKGRHGETGSFLTKWDFQQMRFEEIENTPVGDLQFI